MTKARTQTAITDLVNQTQELFKLNGASTTQVEQFRQMQHAMLQETETFLRHWFERRQEATETAIKGLRELGSKEEFDPTAITQAISDWQGKSLQRMSADLQDWTTLCTHCAQLVAAEEQPVAAEEGEAEPPSARQAGRA
ncbi:hypothetical protein M0534_01275 [Methylonatrum kenyense]|uniref:hypothetical protein n=1 Tax=Methylonatrum kenyense TaxID=455253 RepID=UPI0020C0F377|nr:hypothetical protein [Methylonatrum kenyense]MCK8514962.1 hypothetical protein [Methylonatrum kenyense]